MMSLNRSLVVRKRPRSNYLLGLARLFVQIARGEQQLIYGVSGGNQRLDMCPALPRRTNTKVQRHTFLYVNELDLSVSEHLLTHRRRCRQGSRSRPPPRNPLSVSSQCLL
ncbi:hypothetical protein IF1G_08748 [Cordyceps javanica]|uniref:Uncharacterized protein n=1 Tax=Cordyceps javanica TaxID=43265 RepID=A0A545UTM8_9HYPO|nr:hypothetical protein IF1G_08748 [Cordyceps javanica]